MPLVDEIVAARRTHKLLIGAGGGARVRHTLHIGLSLGLPVGALANLVSNVDAQNAKLLAAVFAKHRGVLIDKEEFLKIPLLIETGMIPIMSAMPPYHFWEPAVGDRKIPLHAHDLGMFVIAEVTGARSLIYIKDEDGLYDLAIADVDGDGRAELVVAGRHGPLKDDDTKEHLDHRRETGDLSLLRLAGDQLAVVTRASWAKGTSLRLRSVAVGDLDGDHRADIVVGGQWDADGKPALAVFHATAGKLVLDADASGGDGTNGEVKDLAIAGDRVIATGVIGEKPGRQGDVAVYRYASSALQRTGDEVSRNGDETRARALVVVPGTAGRAPALLTIGHAKSGTAMIGQILRWDVAFAAPR